MTLTLYEKVSLNFGSGVVAVALIGTLSYVSLGKLAIATRSAGDTQAVLEQVESLRATIDDAGMAQRDYLLGGRAGDLERFENARMTAQRNLTRLQGMAGGEHDSKNRADSLAPALGTHLGELERIAMLRQQRGLEAAAVAMRDDDIAASHDRLDALLGEFRDDQRLVYASRTREHAKARLGPRYAGAA